MPAQRLLLVHAHPDDESIGQGATMAKYAAEGRGVTLVTCTAGEQGEILVPALEHLAAEQDDALGEHRRGELAAAMAELGAAPGQISASIGPSICGRCYEVPEEMRADSSATLPDARSVTRWGTPALDLRAGAVSVLTAAGIPAAEIDADHPCTLECEDFFSYRRQSRTGRFAGVIRRR